MEYLILFLPLIGSLISGFFGKLIGDKFSEILTSLFVSISAILSVFIFYKVLTVGYENNLIIATWARAKKFPGLDYKKETGWVWTYRDAIISLSLSLFVFTLLQWSFSLTCFSFCFSPMNITPKQYIYIYIL